MSERESRADRDLADVDYNLTYRQTGADNDWRWQEQWLPLRGLVHPCDRGPGRAAQTQAMMRSEVCDV